MWSKVTNWSSWEIRWEHFSGLEGHQITILNFGLELLLKTRNLSDLNLEKIAMEFFSCSGKTSPHILPNFKCASTRTMQTSYQFGRNSLWKMPICSKYKRKAGRQLFLWLKTAKEEQLILPNSRTVKAIWSSPKFLKIKKDKFLTKPSGLQVKINSQLIIKEFI